MLKNQFFYLPALLLSLLAACTSKNDTPEAITMEFWKNLPSNAQRSKELSTKQSQIVLEAIEKNQSAFSPEITIISTTINGDNATVKTSTEVEFENGSEFIEFDTTLVKVDKSWKVDALKSVGAMTHAAMMKAMSGVKDAMHKGSSTESSESSEPKIGNE